MQSTTNFHGEGSTHSIPGTEEQSADGSAERDAQHKFHQSGGSLRDEAREIARIAKERGKSFLHEQLSGPALEISTLATVADRAADELSHKACPVAARYTRQAAEGLKNFSDALQNSDFEDISKRTEQYANSNPAVFLGLTVAAGFLLSKFLMSSFRDPAAGHAKSQPGHHKSGGSPASSSPRAASLENPFYGEEP